MSRSIGAAFFIFTGVDLFYISALLQEAAADIVAGVASGVAATTATAAAATTAAAAAAVSITSVAAGTFSLFLYSFADFKDKRYCRYGHYCIYNHLFHAVI